MGPQCEDAQQQFMRWMMQMKGILVTQSAKGKAVAAFNHKLTKVSQMTTNNQAASYKQTM